MVTPLGKVVPKRKLKARIALLNPLAEPDPTRAAVRQALDFLKNVLAPKF